MGCGSMLLHTAIWFIWHILSSGHSRNGMRFFIPGPTAFIIAVQNGLMSSFTLHGTGNWSGTGNGNNGLLYIILYCSHSETETGTSPIVSYCAGPGSVPVPPSVQCERAISSCVCPCQVMEYVEVIFCPRKKNGEMQ